MKRFIRNHPVTSFFVLAFVIDWGVRYGFLSVKFPLINLIGEYAPFIAACVVTGALYGRSGVKTLLGRLKQWRAAPGWYLFVIFGSAAVQLTALLLFWLFTGTGFHFVSGLVTQPFLLLLGVLLSVGEEVGWRGFAQPHLQQRYGMVRAALIIGVLWALWHIPGDFTSLAAFTNMNEYVGLAWFMVITVTTSLLMAWVYNHTQGKLPLMCILHLTVTIFFYFVDVPQRLYGPFSALHLSIILLAAATVALIAVSNLLQKHRSIIELQSLKLEA